MLKVFLSFLSAVGSAISAVGKVISGWLSLKKTQQDEQAGIAMQVAADQKAETTVLTQELKADANAGGIDGAIDAAKKGKF